MLALTLLLTPGMQLERAMSPVAVGATYATFKCRARASSMGLFDSLAAAFENDQDLGESGPAGLNRKADVHTITWLGPKPEGPAALFEKQPKVEQEAIAGQRLQDLAQAAQIPIKYSCMQVIAASMCVHRNFPG